MPGPLAGADHPIVTGSAGLTGGAVIKKCHQPVINDMADITGQRGRQMINPFTNADHAVMTDLAGAEDLGMVDRRHWYPCKADMAALTIRRGTDMGGVLARRNTAVMAGGAGLSGGTVIKNRHLPVVDNVADIARQYGR